MSMIRSCPERLEFKNECYSTVNQSWAKNIDICINFMARTKTKPFLKREKVPKFYFHFGQQNKCPPFSFNIYLAMWKYNCEPLWYVVFRLCKILLLDRCFHPSPNISSSIILIYTILLLLSPFLLLYFQRLQTSDNDQITYLGFTFVLKKE
jgi:hypothetical protein